MPETNSPIAVTGRTLADLAKLIGSRTHPPVDRWNPDHCGNSDMRIAADGSWYHMGTRIDRPAMVRLFSTVLRREPDGSHVLVTPVEKLTIEVEVTAFRAIVMTSEGEGDRRTIAFELDSGDALILGPDHPLTVVQDGHGPSPRIAVRHGLEALIARPLYYELAEIALAEDHDPPGIWSSGTFSAMSIAARLKAALALPPPPGLLPGDLIEGSPDPHQLAAVLIAITDRSDPGVLLTVRRDDMRLHAGQVAFPGGRIDAGENATQAALREAWEEIGLPQDAVDLWGAADEYRTITGYAVTPIVGVVPADLDLSPHEHEVAELFEVPLSFLLASANQLPMSGDYKGMTRTYYQIDWNGRRIWGATAAMIVNLTTRLEHA